MRLTKRRAGVAAFLALVSVCTVAALPLQDKPQVAGIEVEDMWPLSVRINGTVTFVVRGIHALPPEGVLDRMRSPMA
jgi:hypothetical protein